MPNVNPQNFGEWGKTASTSYLTSGSSLNKEIAKIAVENDLNPAQIKRVCENANLTTYKSLFFNSRDKALDFDIATPEKVAQEIEAVQGEPKSIDYLTPPNIKKTANLKKIDRIFGEILNEFDGTAETIKKASRVSKKVSAAEKEMNSRLYIATMKKQASEKRLYDIMKQMVMSGHEFKKIAAIAVDQASVVDIKPVMADIYTKMRDDGIFGVREKVAMKIPNDIIQEAVDSDQATAKKNGAPKTVNNNHPLVQEVNTLQENIISEDNLRKGTWLLKDTAKVMKGKIQNLNTSEKRDKAVKEITGEDDTKTKAYEVFTHQPG